MQFRFEVRAMNVVEHTLSFNRALKGLRTGAALIHSHNKAGERAWYVCPGGPVTDAVATEIKAHPSVVGQKDGLFPGLDQTFRMASFIK
jgi:hypothetical protein